MQRHALVLFHIADLSIEEIARETESPTGTVKARLSRGRATLANLLTDEASARLGVIAQSHGASTPARESEQP